MPSRRTAKRKERQAAILAAAEREHWRVVDQAAWQALLLEFSEVSASTLHHDLRETGLPMDPLVEGVRLDTIEDLSRTLLALAELYQSIIEFDPKATMNPARRRVLDARRKAEVVLRNLRVDPAKHAAMEEKFLWLRTWLENPGLFHTWAPLRLEILRNPQGAFQHPS